MTLLLLRLSHFSELAGCKVSYDCLQHHHHPWHHRHRRQHQLHAVHRLFQSDLFPSRACTTSLPPQPPPRRALPSFPDWDGVPLKEFRWPQHNVKVNFHKKNRPPHLHHWWHHAFFPQAPRLSSFFVRPRLAASNPVAPPIRQPCSQSINIMHYDDFANVRSVQL